MKKYTFGIGVFVGVLCAVLLVLWGMKTSQVQGSAVVGNEYIGTTSPGGIGAGIALIKNGPGTLGSVVLTGANTGTFAFYDATTSDINKRTNNTPTSTLALANFPTNTATSTYVFDIIFTNGLLYVGTGSIPTTTVTFR